MSSLGGKEFLIIFERIMDYLVSIIESHDLLDFDLTDESLSVISDRGVHLINRQVSNCEIWLSSPIIGPKHFQYKDHLFLTHDGLEFFDVLSDEFGLSFSNSGFISYGK